MSWRNCAAQIIARVLDTHQRSDEATIKAALFAAYPWGPRKHHPYKIWLDEIARQRGRKPKLGTRKKRPGIPPASDPDPRQTDLF